MKITEEMWYKIYLDWQKYKFTLSAEQFIRNIVRIDIHPSTFTRQIKLFETGKRYDSQVIKPVLEKANTKQEEKRDFRGWCNDLINKYDPEFEDFTIDKEKQTLTIKDKTFVY